MVHGVNEEGPVRREEKRIYMVQNAFHVDKSMLARTLSYVDL